jgi:hypothetical protein
MRATRLAALALLSSLVGTLGCGGEIEDTSQSSTLRASRFPEGRNPVPGWSPSRLDQGVDGVLRGGRGYGFHAPFDARVVYALAHASGWKGSGYMVLKILRGPLNGQFIYVAEGCLPMYHAGTDVRAGERVCDLDVSPYSNIRGDVEIGFANPHDWKQPLAQVLRGYAGDQSVAGITAGEAMNHLIRDLGGSGGRNESGRQPDYALLPDQIRDALGL